VAVRKRGCSRQTDIPAPPSPIGSFSSVASPAPGSVFSGPPMWNRARTGHILKHLQAAAGAAGFEFSCGGDFKGTKIVLFLLGRRKKKKKKRKKPARNTRSRTRECRNRHMHHCPDPEQISRKKSRKKTKSCSPLRVLTNANSSAPFRPRLSMPRSRRKLSLAAQPPPARVWFFGRPSKIPRRQRPRTVTDKQFPQEPQRRTVVLMLEGPKTRVLDPGSCEEGRGAYGRIPLGSSACRRDHQAVLILILRQSRAISFLLFVLHSGTRPPKVFGMDRFSRFAGARVKFRLLGFLSKRKENKSSAIGGRRRMPINKKQATSSRPWLTQARPKLDVVDPRTPLCYLRSVSPAPPEAKARGSFRPRRPKTNPPKKIGGAGAGPSPWPCRRDFTHSFEPHNR